MVMEFLKGGKQWVIFGVILAGLVLYNLFFRGGPSLAPEDLAAREPEVNNLFERIPVYPGSKPPEKGKAISPGLLLIERIYPAQSPDYEQVRAFYVKEGPAIGWEPIGQVPTPEGFASPVQIMRSGEYHLLISVSPTSVRLRIIMGDLAQLVGQKVLPD